LTRSETGQYRLPIHDHKPAEDNFGDMRASGVRELLIYCRDHRCTITSRQTLNVEPMMYGWPRFAPLSITASTHLFGSVALGESGIAFSYLNCFQSCRAFRLLGGNPDFGLLSFTRSLLLCGNAY
jgi:hypothetical protein